MRLAVTIVLILVVAVVGGAFALSRLIRAEELRDQIIADAESATGHALAIDGRLDLSILPRPTLSFAEARFIGPTNGTGPVLDVDRVDLGIDALALVRGRIEVEEVRLVRPRLRLDWPEQRPGGLLELLAVRGLLPDRATVARLSVVDGEAVIGQVAAEALILERIDVDVEARADRGPFFIDGSFVHAGQPFTVAARLGHLTEDPNTTLQLNLETAAAATADLTLSYQGIVSLERLSELRGQIGIAGDRLGMALGLLGSAIWRDRLPPALDLPFAFDGALESGAGEVRLGNLQVALGAIRGRGRLGFALAEPPRFDLQLDLPRVDGAGLGVARALLGPLGHLSTVARGELDLTIGALVRRDAAARRVRLTLGLEAGEGILLRQARAVLPGDADVSLEGRITVVPEPRFDGRLTAVTDRSGELLAWLGADLPEEAVPRFRTLSFATDVSAGTEAIRLTSLDGRLDASRVQGSMVYGLGGRPRIEADLAVDRISLDQYAPDARLRHLGALLAGRLRAVDLELRLALDRLTAGEIRWSGLSVDAGAALGRLEIRKFEAEPAAETRLTLAGVVDLIEERADLEGTLRSARPGPLLRGGGYAPAVGLARLGALEVEAKLDGGWSGASIEASAGLGAFRTTVGGRVALDDADRPALELEVEVGHPDYARLLDDLGIGSATALPDEPLEGAGKLRLRAEHDLELIGHLGLGPTRVTGQINHTRAGARRRIDAKLSLGEPRLETLVPLLALAGHRLDLGAFGGDPLGGWPAIRFDPGPLRALDGRVVLSGKGGLARDGLEAELSSEAGLLKLERGTLRLGEGEVDLEGSLDLRAAVARIALVLEARRVGVKGVLGALGIGPVLEGQLDLYGVLTASGDLPYELVRSLHGDVALSVRGGSVSLPVPGSGDVPGAGLEPAPLELLEAQFDVHRGLARLTRLDLDTADAAWRGDGLVDLLVWIADLTLVNAEDERRIRIVGPPDDAQVRLHDPGAVAPAE